MHEFAISIHAPAWGATAARADQHKRPCHFNPRSRVGSDRGSGSTGRFSTKFQSTLPRGERQTTITMDSLTRLISIHAPAWGATTRSSLRPNDIVNFNPRSRVGSDMGAKFAKFEPIGFQSTLPRGERHAVHRYASSVIHISIHAPAWGATAAPPLVVVFTQISIHAPAWGATWIYAQRPAAWTFQSTLPRGERRGYEGWWHAYKPISIHAPAWGATCRSITPYTNSDKISIHAPAWGATFICYFPNSP